MTSSDCRGELCSPADSQQKKRANAVRPYNELGGNNMTQWILSSSLLIAVVLLIRKVAGDRLSARVRYALWGLVLLRLLVPVSIGESALSVQNWLPEKQVQNTVTQQLPIYTTSDSEEIINTTQPTQSVTAPVEVSKSVSVLPVVYVVGCVVVGLVFLLSNLMFWLRLSRSRVFVTKQTLPVYETGAIESPCMYGLLRPAVYVTPAVLADKTAQQYVLAHELTHYRHGDHVWSFLRCLAVILHWYNPLVWMASFASQLDGELACDEGALRRIGESNRNEYARTLINLTCVGYGGMLTTATSMTGRRCDLRNRVVRIAKNPKMTVTALVAVLVIAAVVAVMLFSGATAPAIEGVWRMEISALGVGMNQDTEAYMEYEFSDGQGRRVDYIDGQIRSAERFTYTINGDTVTLAFAALGPVRDYTWSVQGDTLTLADQRAERHLTAAERESVPYLPDEYWAPVSVVADYPNNRLVSDLTDTQQAQLMELLRSGYSGEKRKEVLDNDPYMINITTAQHGMTIANGLVYVQKPNGAKEGYVLSNMAEIEAWLRTLAWKGELNKNLETSGFTPEAMTDIVEARMILYGNIFYADPARLAFLEELLTTAEDMGWVSGCPFEGILEVTLSNGRVLGVTPALDSCAAFLIGDRCYEYGNQFENPADDANYDNSELLAIFGLDSDTIMNLWEEVRQQQQGEVIGGLNDQGDVIRVQNDVMEPAYMTDEQRELMMALLAQGIGEPIGKLDGDFSTDYYTIFSSGQDTADGYVWLCDDGNFYMDSLQYELSTANELLSLLDRQYPIRISHDGRPMDAELWNSALGEDVYFELQGVPEGAEVTWTSDNEQVCTVSGDAYGATVRFVGVGEAKIAAEYRSKWNAKGYTFYVTCSE